MAFARLWTGAARFLLDALDMTHVTERCGSPQSLVCTKDRRSYERRVKEYHSEIAAMRALVDLAPGAASARTLVKKMTGAIEAK
jgi:hypothetical protein